MSDFEGHIRGEHRHFKTIQAAICINGSCRITVVKSGLEKNFELTKKNQCLILEPEDWHSIVDGKNNPILLMLASHHYDPSDYASDPL